MLGSLHKTLRKIGGNIIMGKRLRFSIGFALSAVMAVWVFLVVGVPEAQAEYGDVVINNYADKAGMRPVVFPHWFHRIRFACKVCHADLGFKFKAGGNDITMAKIIDGQFCGACHNGEIAWSVENCNMCHSGIPGTPSQVHNSTQTGLVYTPKAGSAPGGSSARDAQSNPSVPSEAAPGKKRK